MLDNAPYSATRPDTSLSHSQPSRWFTSLWTLQEVCLHPDMVLCDRDWESLTISQSFMVPIDHIVVLWHSVHEAIIRQRQSWPKGVAVIGFLERTGMGELPRMLPLTILMLGN
jgi:hypothetical protein